MTSKGMQRYRGLLINRILCTFFSIFAQQLYGSFFLRSSMVFRFLIEFSALTLVEKNEIETQLFTHTPQTLGTSILLQQACFVSCKSDTNRQSVISNSLFQCRFTVQHCTRTTTESCSTQESISRLVGGSPGNRIACFTTTTISTVTSTTVLIASCGTRSESKVGPHAFGPIFPKHFKRTV